MRASPGGIFGLQDRFGGRQGRGVGGEILPGFRGGLGPDPAAGRRLRAYIVVLVESGEQSVSDLEGRLLHESGFWVAFGKSFPLTRPLDSNGGFGLKFFDAAKLETATAHVGQKVGPARRHFRLGCSGIWRNGSRAAGAGNSNILC